MTMTQYTVHMMTVKSTMLES